MPEPLISENDTVQRCVDHIASGIGDDTVLLSLRQNDCFGMNAVGAGVWKLLESPQTVSDLCQALRKEFAVSREECQADVLEFFSQMADDGLVEPT